ncbi:predicted protein [Postia placenta Mad-698-R]|nr:predicted protein [Postia placenta Mad-698-R]
MSVDSIEVEAKRKKHDTELDEEQSANSDLDNSQDDEEQDAAEAEASESDDEQIQKLAEHDPQALAEQFCPTWSNSSNIAHSAVNTLSGLNDKALKQLAKAVVTYQSPVPVTPEPGVSTSVKAIVSLKVVSGKDVSHAHTCTRTSWHKHLAIEEPTGKDTGDEGAKSVTLLEPDDSDSDDMNDKNDKPVDNVEDDAENINIVPPVNGNTLQLNNQHTRIQDVVHAAIKKVLIDICFDDAFPDVLMQSKHAQLTLVKCAQTLEYEDIQQRILDDMKYGRTLASLCTQRVSTFRSQVKSKCDAYSAAEFKFKLGCGEAVKWLLHNFQYIYPHDTKHPAIISSFRACFFTGPSGMGNKYPEPFTLSLPEKPDEKEMTIPLLALVATAEHALLTNWASGHFRPTDFKAAAYADAYGQHVILLNEIKKNSAARYHTLMRDLYNEVSLAAPTTQDTGFPSGALVLIDFVAMATD